MSLLTRESSNTGKLLALEQLERSTTTGRDVAELVLNTVLGSDGGSVTTTNDDNLTSLGSGNSVVESGLGAASELLELEDTTGAVPQNGLGLVNGLLEELDRLLTAVETHPAVGDALLVGSLASVGVLVELVGGDEVSRKDNLDVVLLGLLNKVLDSLAAGLVEERVTNLHVLKSLLEGESHTTTDDEAVDLAEEVVNELNLVRDLGTTEDGKEGTLGLLKGLSEVVELLLDEETGGLLGEVDTDHGAVGTVSGTESIVLGDLLVCVA